MKRRLPGAAGPRARPWRQAVRDPDRDRHRALRRPTARLAGIGSQGNPRRRLGSRHDSPRLPVGEVSGLVTTVTAAPRRCRACARAADKTPPTLHSSALIWPLGGAVQDSRSHQRGRPEATIAGRPSIRLILVRSHALPARPGPRLCGRPARCGALGACPVILSLSGSGCGRGASGGRPRRSGSCPQRPIQRRRPLKYPLRPDYRGVTRRATAL